MKKFMLSSVLVISVLCIQPIHSQSGSPAASPQNQKDHPKLSPDERVKKETEEAVTKLGLSADQKTKWENACRERISANAPLKEKMEGSTTPDERKALQSQKEVNNQKFDAAVNGFLNDDQKVKYESFKKEKKGKKHGSEKKGMH